MFFDLSLLIDAEDLAPTPQQKRSRAKQQAIYEAAASVFSEKGYHRTNTKEIAARANVSIGTLYFQFSDKRQILLNLLANQIKGYAGLREVDAYAVQTDPVAYFVYQMRLAFPYNATFYSIVDTVRELTREDEAFARRFGLLRQAVYERVGKIVAVAEAAKMTHPTLDTESTVQTITNLLFNFYAIMPNPARVSEEMYWRRHQNGCEIICRAIFKDDYF